MQAVFRRHAGAGAVAAAMATATRNAAVRGGECSRVIRMANVSSSHISCFSTDAEKDQPRASMAYEDMVRP